MSLLKIKPFIIDDTTANDAFVRANTAFLKSNSAGDFANGAFDRANAAYAQANTGSTDTWVRTQANNAFDTANSGASFANSSFLRANSGYDQANTGASFANGSFVVANSAASFANGSFVVANVAFDRANAAYNAANTATDSWVRTQANNSFNKANSAAEFANASFLVANSAFAWGNHATVGYATTTYVGTAVANLVNSAPVTLDTLNELAAALGNDANFSATITNMVGTANSFANGAFVRANASYDAQNTTASFANGSFVTANASYVAQNTTALFANAAFITANASYASQNTTALFANGAFDRANSAASFANGAFTAANTADTKATSLSSFANGAFDRANAAYAQANTGGSGTDIWVRGQANAAFTTANLAYNVVFNSSNTASLYYITRNFTGDGNTNTFTISSNTSANSILIFDNGITQNPLTDYSVTGNTITFVESPANGSIIQVRELLSNVPVIVESPNSNSAFDRANSAYATANAAFLQANNSTDSWVRTQANNAYDTANSGASFANSAFITANASFAWGNHATVGYATTIYVSNAIANLVNSAPVTLDTLNELAAALGNDANFSTTITNTLGTTNLFANGAFLRANASYDAQNTTASFANGAFDRANSAASFANGAFVTANASYTSQNTTALFANGAFDRANSAASFANGAFAHANAAYIAANNSTDTWVRTQANSAYDKANSSGQFANASFLTANSSYVSQNTTASFANAAFDRANAAYGAANTGGSDSWARAQANAAYNAANTGGGTSVTVSGTAPYPAANGSLWYDDTTTGELFVYSSNSWVSTSIMPAINVNDPVITGPNQANEATTQTYTISNYNGAYAYIISITGGLVTRTNNSIYWTMPSVTTNTTHYMTTQVVSDGVTSAVDTRTVLVVNLNIADAAVIVSDFSSTYANVTFGWA